MHPQHPSDPPRQRESAESRMGDLLCQDGACRSRACLRDQRLNLSFIIYKQCIYLNFWQLLSQGSATACTPHDTLAPHSSGAGRDLRVPTRALVLICTNLRLQDLPGDERCTGTFRTNIFLKAVTLPDLNHLKQLSPSSSPPSSLIFCSLHSIPSSPQINCTCFSFLLQLQYMLLLWSSSLKHHPPSCGA